MDALNKCLRITKFVGEPALIFKNRNISRKFSVVTQLTRFRVTVRVNTCLQRHSSYQLSYAHSTGKEALGAYTIGNFVDIMPERYPEREAVVDCLRGIRKNYVQYKEEIDQLATGFLALGLNRGDNIGIWSPNNYEWMLTQFAAAKAGLVLVTLNPAYQSTELEYCMKKLRIRALVIAENFRIQEYYKMITSVAPEITESRPGMITSKSHPYFDTLVVMTDNDLPGAYRFKDVMLAGGSTDKHHLEKIQKDIQFNDPVNIQFTSGTTGQPKAAVLNHQSLIYGNLLNGHRMGFDKDVLRMCASVPFFHCFGCVHTTLLGVTNGTCVVIPAPAFHPGLALKSIQDEKINCIYGTPTMFRDMVSLPDFRKYDTSSLIVGVVGGAGCPPGFIKKISRELKCPYLGSSYGMTELGGALFNASGYVNPVELRHNYSGRIYNGFEAQIVDSNGRIVPVNIPGEIWARGACVMNGYFEDEEATEKTMAKGGWFRTGDIGTINEKGYLTVIDRMKDMIIRGGENIYPKEIEDFLSSHPKIAEVQVVGVDDERLGEETCAFIKLKLNETLTEEDIRNFCAGKILSIKIPRYINFLEEFQRTTSGKVQKFVLRKLMKEKLLTDRELHKS